MATDPLTGSRYPVGSDVPNVAQYIQNAVFDLADNTIPRFTTTTARDTAYSSWVAAGGTMADGLHCVVNGIPYRRIGGTWRTDNGPRIITRSTAPNSTIASGGGNETGVTTTALASFTLYEAATVGVTCYIRGGGAGALVGYAKIDGAQIGDQGVTRSDVTTTTVGAVALAAGSHSVAVHVDASGGSILWVSSRIIIVVGQAE